MILLIDNYDSFSYNLYQLCGSIDPNIRVVRNDAVTVRDVAALAPKHIILSPGPGRPENAGICVELVRALGSRVPILGVCLGHQAITVAYGGKVSYAKTLMHGKQSVATLSLSCPLFSGCPERAPVARYHSLAAQEKTLPETLSVTARADDGEIMGIAHTRYPVYGVQFHPESVLTPIGRTVIQNFLTLGGERHD